MAINLTKDELLGAIKQIDENPNLKSGRHSSTYDLVYKNVKYPPILVLSLANEKKNGTELTLQDFGNNVEVPFKFLRDNDFEIVPKSRQINNRQAFKDWLLNNLAEKSGAIGSYIISIEWLSKKFYENNIITQKSIFEIEDLDVIDRLYSEAREKQKDKTSYIYNHSAPSYGDSHYYTASLKKYGEFLQFKSNKGQMKKEISDNGHEVQKINLLDEFVNWFIERDGSTHNYFSGQFSSRRDRLINELEKAEEVYEKEFGGEIFTIPEDNIDYFIKSLSQNLSKNSGLFYDYSSAKSNHRPRAILGKNNYIKFLIDKTKVPSTNSTKIIPSIKQVNFDILAFQNKCMDAGLVYAKQLTVQFTSSLLTKPFVILTGLSGSGKTKLAQVFVQWICQDRSQYCIIPVGADWTNREPLLGYPNALDHTAYVKPDNGALDLIIHANANPDLPHFLILDEMNLSHVERYFADFLSAMESKEEIPLFAEDTVGNGVPSQLKLPSNLFIIGTVNIDETTNMFSPKVLDRANTIEFRVTRDDMESFFAKVQDIDMELLTAQGANMAVDFLRLAHNKEFDNKQKEKINSILLEFFIELKKIGAEFGYRSASELLRLINQLSILDPDLTVNQKLDIAIMQKLLPKLHGSRRKLCSRLESLGKFCIPNEEAIVKNVFEKEDYNFENNEVLYPLSLEKIARMHKGAIENGFASFAEA